MTSESHQPFPFAVYAPYILPTQHFPFMYGPDILTQCNVPMGLPPFACAPSPTTGLPHPRMASTDRPNVAQTPPSTPIVEQKARAREPSPVHPSSPGLQLTVLHKPRGSQGSWIPIENEQRVRVTSVRGKNIRVVLRATVPVDWSSLRITLWERSVERVSDQFEKGDSARSFSIESRNISEEVNKTAGAPSKTFVFSADVKLYTIHRSCMFKAEIKTRTADATELQAYGPDMITHNSGRRDNADTPAAAQPSSPTIIAVNPAPLNTNNNNINNSHQFQQNPKKRSSPTDDAVMLPPTAKRRGSEDRFQYSQVSSPSSSCTSWTESPIHSWNQEEGDGQQHTPLPSFASFYFPPVPPMMHPSAMMAPLPRTPSPSNSHTEVDELEGDSAQEDVVMMLETLRKKARLHSEGTSGPSAFSSRSTRRSH